MSVTKAYGSITIVDIGDLGTLSVQPEVNSTTSVIFDHNNITINNNQNDYSECYSPNWAKQPITIKPIIYYAGAPLSLSEGDPLTITWERRTTTEEPSPIVASAGEVYDARTGELKISQNQLSQDVTSLSYICNVKFIEPHTGQELNAAGQISFSLTQVYPKVKSCRIYGGNVFKFQSDQSLVGTEEITLTAQLFNCTAGCWKYWTTRTVSGQAVTDFYRFTNDETDSPTITINRKNNTYKIGEAAAVSIADLFNDQTATIRYVSNDENIYDDHIIAELHDGAAGSALINASMLNEDMYIPCNSSGTPNDKTFDSAICTLRVYFGNENITGKAGLKVDVELDGITGNWKGQEPTQDNSVPSIRNESDITGQDRLEFKAAGFRGEASTGHALFSISYEITDPNDINNKLTYTTEKTFYLTKLKAGVDGKTPTIYSVELNSAAVSRQKNGAYSTIVATAYKTTVDASGVSTKSIATNLPIYLSYKNGNVYTQFTDASSNNGVLSYTPRAVDDHTEFRATVHGEGTGYTSDYLDFQTAPVVSEGQDSLSILLSEPSAQIPCDKDGTRINDSNTYTLTPQAYIGTTECDCSMALSGSHTGLSYANGVLTVDKSAALGEVTEIPFTITATYNSKTVGSGVRNFRLVKNRQGEKGAQGDKGADSVLLRVYALNGHVFENGEGEITLGYYLTSGTKDVSDQYDLSWYKLSDTGYTKVIQDANHTFDEKTYLTITPNAINAYAAFKLVATNKEDNSIVYEDSIAVFDKTDPMQVTIFSTIGDKITNGIGSGCLYVRMFQSGEEKEPLQNLKVSTAQPQTTDGVNGDVWIQYTEGVTLSNGEIRFHTWEKVSGKWQRSDGLPDTNYSYKWIFLNRFGNETGLTSDKDTTEYTDRFLYIDGSYISYKKQFNIQVEKLQS